MHLPQNLQRRRVWLVLLFTTIAGMIILSVSSLTSQAHSKKLQR